MLWGYSISPCVSWSLLIKFAYQSWGHSYPNIDIIAFRGNNINHAAIKLKYIFEDVCGINKAHPSCRREKWMIFGSRLVLKFRCDNTSLYVSMVQIINDLNGLIQMSWQTGLEVYFNYAPFHRSKKTNKSSMKMLYKCEYKPRSPEETNIYELA